MDVYETIEKRRTIRSFKQGVTDEQLEKILLAGVRAPSGSNIQPWEFIVVDDPVMVEKIAELKYEQTLKMTLDNLFLKHPETIEQVFRQKYNPPPTVQGSLKQKEAYRNATVLAVCNHKGHGNGRKPWMNAENAASIWMCIENMMLAATADGLGMQISIFREEHKIAVENLLGIPNDYELATMLVTGVPAELPREKAEGVMRPAFSWLHKNKFGVYDIA
jgi:nitroreductase